MSGGCHTRQSLGCAGGTFNIHPNQGCTVGSHLGIVAKRRGDYLSALAHYEEGLAINQALGLQPEIAQTLVNMAQAHRSAGQTTDRIGDRVYYKQALAIYEGISDKDGGMIVIRRLASIAQGEKRFW